MERAYYLVKSGKVREDALKMQNEIELQRKRNKEIVKEISLEEGIDPDNYYVDSITMRITAVSFKDEEIAAWDKWKKIEGTGGCGYMPKQNSKWGRELYKRITGKMDKDGNAIKTKNLDMSSVIPKEKCFDWKFSGGMHQAHFTTCFCLPFRVFDMEDVVIVSVPYDEMKLDCPNDIPEDIIKHWTRIKPCEMQAEYDKFNQLAKERNLQD